MARNALHTNRCIWGYKCGSRCHSAFISHIAVSIVLSINVNIYHNNYTNAYIYTCTYISMAVIQTRRESNCAKFVKLRNGCKTQPTADAPTRFEQREGGGVGGVHMHMHMHMQLSHGAGGRMMEGRERSRVKLPETVVTVAQLSLLACGV
jgi:hypothetical protein